MGSMDIIEDLIKAKEAAEQTQGNPRDLIISRSAFVYLSYKYPKLLEFFNVKIIEDNLGIYEQKEYALSFQYEPIENLDMYSEKPAKNRTATKKKYRYKKRNKKRKKK